MSDINFNSIVISTRIRLARNFKKYPFVLRMSADNAKEIIKNVSDSILNRLLQYLVPKPVHGSLEALQKRLMPLRQH